METITSVAQTREDAAFSLRTSRTGSRGVVRISALGYPCHPARTHARNLDASYGVTR